ncbi:hypothetical protein D3C72_788460 [compost metagenome]
MAFVGEILSFEPFFPFVPKVDSFFSRHVHEFFSKSRMSKRPSMISWPAFKATKKYS